MNKQSLPEARIVPDLDVLIVGAGISGIDAAYHLRKHRPGTRFAIVDAKSDIGGTWHTHQFPGIRSDSDLFTFGFKWKPWMGVPIATASEILAYLNEAVDENDLRRHMRFAQDVRAASWSSKDQLWNVTLCDKTQNEEHRLSCRFLWMCAGYYRHDEGFTPDIPGIDDFGGPVIHPQTWPGDLDYSGKSLIVIGSGATAATLVPALAEKAAHVTMLQRSPTYFYPRPQNDEFTETLRALDLPKDWFHEIMRRRMLHEQSKIMQRARETPEVLAREFIAGARAYLGSDFDIKTHFTPRYRPWHQRLAVIPDGDLFKAIKSGRASVVTDEIDRIVPEGIRLKSGETLEADILVTATGLHMTMLGEIALDLDGVPFDIAESVTHRGIMLSGLPNLVHVFGYLRTSWTMRANLVSDYVCRLLAHMEERGAVSVTPRIKPEELPEQRRPWIDPENFNPGYITRALSRLPQQGKQLPWIMTQDYFVDREELPAADFDDGTLEFSDSHSPVRKAATV